MSGPFDALTGQEEQGQQQPLALALIVTHRNAANAVFGVLPPNHYVYNVRMDVEQAFDGGTTMEVGNASDTDAYCTATAVATTGIKTPTLGASGGYEAQRQTVKATLSGTPTQGKAVVIVEFYRVPKVN